MPAPLLADTPQHYPGVCLDGSQNGPVVLMHAATRGEYWVGCIYLSQPQLRAATRLMPELVEELAGEIGWVPADYGDAEIEDRDRRIAELEGRLVELEPVERALYDAASRFEPAPAPRPARKRAAA